MAPKRPVSRPGVPFALALGLFLLSGIGALIIESTWLRWFRVLLGATAPAASATLVAFFLGQMAGAFAGAALAVRTQKPLRAYALLEATAAAAALATAPLLALLVPFVDAFYDEGNASGGWITAARFGVALLATLPASAAFGATFPILTRAVTRDPRQLGRQGGALYAANTAGAAIGAALAAFVLPGLLGVRGTLSVGIGCLLLAAVAAAGSGGDASAETPTSPAPPRPRIRVSWAVLAAASGFGIFASQVLLTQAFARVLNQSTHAFGAVLVTALVALALGASLSSRFRFATARTMVGVAATAAALGFAFLPAVLVASTDGLAYLGSDRGYPGYLIAALGLAAMTAGPPWLAAGMVWPALLGVAGDDETGDGRAAGHVAGRLLAWNTLGAVVGSLAATWWWLPAFGLWGSLTLVAIGYGAVAIAVPGPGRPIRAGLLMAVATGLAVLAPPHSLPSFRTEAQDRVLEATSTPSGLIAVIERDGGRLIQTDNHYALGGTADRVHQERQGHLPLLLHPGARSALFLGSATGSSAAAALHHDVERLVLVEIVPGVAKAAAKWFNDANGGVHTDPRTHVVVDDARSYVRAGRERFDVIVGDLFVPWRSGTGSLYTTEHFRAVRDRLQPGGLFCQWLPLYQLTEAELQTLFVTFHDVFPDAMAFRGDFYGSHPILALVGGAGLMVDTTETGRATARLAATGVEDRWMTHPAGPWALYAGPIGAVAAHWDAAPRNTDDRPTLEWLAARQHAGGGAGQPPAFVGLALSQLGKALRESADARGIESVRNFSEAERRASAGGHALQTASALWTAGRSQDAALALQAAADLLPVTLLAEAPEDPTAAEVWPDNPR